MPDVTTSTLDDVIRLVPGYDPFASVGDCWFDKDAAARAIQNMSHEILPMPREARVPAPYEISMFTPDATINVSTSSPTIFRHVGPMLADALAGV